MYWGFDPWNPDLRSIAPQMKTPGAATATNIVFFCAEHWSCGIHRFRVVLLKRLKFTCMTKLNLVLWMHTLSFFPLMSLVLQLLFRSLHQDCWTTGERVWPSKSNENFMLLYNTCLSQELWAVSYFFLLCFTLAQIRQKNPHFTK